MDEREIAFEALILARQTLVTTIANLDANFNILADNRRYHEQAAADTSEIISLLRRIADALDAAR